MFLIMKVENVDITTVNEYGALKKDNQGHHRTLKDTIFVRSVHLINVDISTFLALYGTLGHLFI